MEVIEALEPLVQAGHRRNAEKINDVMGQFSRNALAVRMLLLRLAGNEVAFALSGAQSFFLYATDSFALRLNAWYPVPRLNQDAVTDFLEYFSIGFCHNHNFDFFTTCVLGEGYHSQFLETSVDTETLTTGSQVPFDREWEERLTLGSSLFVPRDTVFHTQKVPDSFSVTINLIPVGGRSRSGRQYTLDEDRHRVRRVIIAE